MAARPPLAAFFGWALFSLLLASCGGGSAPASPPTSPATTPTPRSAVPQQASPSPQATGAIEPVVVSTDLAVGPNRFVAGLFQGGEILPDARLHFRFFKLENRSQPVLKFETDARALTLSRNFTHTHQDGKLETHQAGSMGVYVCQADFDSPGSWGVEITGVTKDGKPIPPLTPLLEVRERSRSVALGQPAPPTRQIVLADVDGDISRLDTSNPPKAEMHNTTIASAVGAGKPAVIVFASPGFCMSQTCGPVKDVVDQLFQKHGAQASFIHVEPYDVQKARKGELSPVPALAEWGLVSEPWVFMVGKDGKVAAKFEGPVGLDELEQAFARLVA